MLCDIDKLARAARLAGAIDEADQDFIHQRDVVAVVGPVSVAAHISVRDVEDRLDEDEDLVFFDRVLDRVDHDLVLQILLFDDVWTRVKAHVLVFSLCLIHRHNRLKDPVCAAGYVGTLADAYRDV